MSTTHEEYSVMIIFNFIFYSSLSVASATLAVLTHIRLETNGIVKIVFVEAAY